MNMRHRARSSARPSLILITDPGPDPDDVKALLIAACLHNQGHLHLCAVVANGGIARARARLALCVLAHVGTTDVPVGIGSDGATPVSAQLHELAIRNYAIADASSLRDGAELLVDALERAPDRSVRVVCISSLTDFAHICARRPELVRRKVATVAVQGGLVPDLDAASGWAPDTSQNNEFDRAAAAAVYAFCFEHRLAMTVTSRHAVPVIPMQLARSFAERSDCPVMRYLADAQFLGLAGLWQKLCAGDLPARCSKQWFFETFCRVSAEAFESRGLDTLDASVDIVGYLDGVVKPYDVVALMTVLPQARGLFPRDAVFAHKGTEHLLLLQPAHAIDAALVVNLLREVYCEVVLATAASVAGREDIRTRYSSTTVRSSDVSYPRYGRSSSVSVLDADLRTDLRDALGGHGARVKIRVPAAKVDTESLPAFLAASLAYASVQHLRLLRLALALTCASVVTVLPLAAAEVVPETTAMTLVLLGAVILASAIEPSTRGVGGAAAAFACALSCLALTAYALLFWHETRVASRRGVALVLGFAAGDWIVFEREARAVRAIAAALPAAQERVALQAGAALSMLFVLVVTLAVVVCALALAALGWRRRIAQRSSAAAAARARTPPRALSSAALKRALFAWLALTAGWLALYETWQIGVFVAAAAAADSPVAAPRLAAGERERALGFLVCNALVGGALCGFAASSRVQGAVYAALRRCCRTASRRGARISLAALLGFGATDAQLDVRALVGEVARVFVVVTLDARARMILLAACEASGRATDSLRTIAESASAAGVSGGGPSVLSRGWSVNTLLVRLSSSLVSTQLHATSDVAAATTAHPHRAPRGWCAWLRPSAPRVAPAPRGVSERGGTLATNGAMLAGLSGMRPESAPRADAFVVRAPFDQLYPELCAWAVRFEAARGRPPTLWLHEVCADPALSQTELLAHTTCYLARCDTLLVLASPRTPFDLPAATALYCWSVLGGRPEDVEVALARSEAPEQTLAAFDTFHAMHATVVDASALGASDGNAIAYAHRLRVCVQLATVRAFNARVREVMPAVHAAAELRRAAEGAAGAGAECA